MAGWGRTIPLQDVVLALLFEQGEFASADLSVGELDDSMKDGQQSAGSEGEAHAAGGRRWALRDLVDLETALEADRERSPDEVEARDRAWAQALPPGAAIAKRPERLRWWVEGVVRADGEAETPGDRVAQAGELLGRGLGLAGVVLGAITGAGVLRYQGEAPVNVNGFLFVLILLQIVLLVGSLLGVLRLRMARRPGLISGALGSLWEWVLVRFERWRDRAGQQVALPSAASGLGVFYRYHRDVAAYRVLRLGQVFGIGFNLGAITAIFLILLVADRAFGWQSTLIQTPETFHRLVELLAVPWSGWLPAAAPSLEAVEGSRIILKEGVAALETPNLIAWWPFLVMAVVVYGLLPRVLLWAAFWGLERRALARRSFNGLRYEDLDDRIQAARSQVQTGVADRQWLDAAEPAPTEAPATTTSGGEPRRAYTLLIDTDNAAPEAALVRAVEAACKGRVEAVSRVEALLESGIRPERVALVVESWAAPVAEDLERVRQVRAALPADAPIRVLLLPIPGQAAPDARWEAHWKRFLAQARDPNLSVSPLHIEPEATQ